MSRQLVRAAIVSSLRTALATAGQTGGQVQVEPGWPGQQIEPESVWLESSDGNVDYPIFHGQASPSNRLTRQDEYTIPVQIQAAYPNQTLDEAEARVQALFNIVDATLAGAPTPTSDVIFAVLDEVNGPATGRMDKGAQSFYRAVIRVTARTT